MNINKIIEEESDLLMNESFKKIIGGIALAYALTTPLNQNHYDEVNQVEYTSNVPETKLVNIMKDIEKKYPNRVKYFNFVSDNNLVNDVESLKEKNPQLKDKPYTLFMDTVGLQTKIHILSGDQKIIDYFEQNFLTEK
jgi:hypothetical protein